MAQGKAFTPEQRETAIQSLQPYLEMGFSRNKSCALIGLPPQTLSNWVKEDESLGMKLSGWESKLSSLALSNVHQAIQNEAIAATENGEMRMDNTWKLLSKREEGFKDKLDVTSDDKALPTPLLSNVQTNNSTKEDTEPQEKD